MDCLTKPKQCECGREFYPRVVHNEMGISTTTNMRTKCDFCREMRPTMRELMLRQEAVNKLLFRWARK